MEKLREVPELRELMENQNWKGEEFYGQILSVWEDAEHDISKAVSGLTHECVTEYCLEEVNGWVAKRNSSDY